MTDNALFQSKNASIEQNDASLHGKDGPDNKGCGSRDAIRDYDTKIAHVALSREEIDLDNGVKKVQKGLDGKSLGILAKM